MTFNAEQCIAQLNELDGKADIVYMNGKIAEDRGAMLISKVKQIDFNIKILVVANDESAKNLILQYGADDFIIKPVNVGTIFSKASILLFRER